MDLIDILVALLVVGAPLALFLAMRRTTGIGRNAPRRAADEPDSPPPPDYGMSREASAPAQGSEANATASSVAGGAAAAAAGGAFILAAGAARSHAADNGGDSHHGGAGGHGTETGDASDGAGSDGGGGDGGGGDGGGGGGD